MQHCQQECNIGIILLRMYSFYECYLRYSSYFGLLSFLARIAYVKPIIDIAGHKLLNVSPSPVKLSDTFLFFKKSLIEILLKEYMSELSIIVYFFYYF